VLLVFQESGWENPIDDPLPPTAGIDPKDRLHDTIKCLNRRQQIPLLHFGGDGTSEGVVWKYSQKASELLQLKRPIGLTSQECG
jgi:hypothetical protein